MKKRILFVEDTPEKCKEYIEYLEIEGFQIDIAQDIIEFKNHIEKNEYDLISTDMMLTTNKTNKLNETGLKAGYYVANECELKKMKYTILTNLEIERIENIRFDNLYFKGIFNKVTSGPKDYCEELKRILKELK